MQSLICKSSLLLFPSLVARYGFVTNTKVKFIIIISASNVNLRDNDVRGVSTCFHITILSLCYVEVLTTIMQHIYNLYRCYGGAVCLPFLPQGRRQFPWWVSPLWIYFRCFAVFTQLTSTWSSIRSITLARLLHPSMYFPASSSHRYFIPVRLAVSHALVSLFVEHSSLQYLWWWLRIEPRPLTFHPLLR